MDDPVSAQGGTLPEFTVSELSAAVRRMLEGGFARVRVRGELTEVKRYGSGHVYLSLKDAGGKLAGVIWKGVASRIAVPIENGSEVIATGRLTAYADRSAYQLIIDRLDYAGVGALLARIEALRRSLAAEGLFDAAQKRPLPLLPRLIGVITSAQGAVLHDIRTMVARRLPRPILLWPVPVQGDGAAEKIAHAIRAMGALPVAGPGLAGAAILVRPDLIIVARGGGSTEDLMAFNDEAVVRAAAASPVPLISAVGHETDTTLIDFAADQRAPTPTAAAELAVPSRVELLAGLAQSGARLESCRRQAMAHARLRLERAERGLPDLAALLGLARQRLDERSARLDRAVPARTGRLREALAALGQRLERALPVALERKRAVLARAAPRLDPPIGAALARARADLGGLGQLLEALSHERVLERGFALVADGSGAPVTRAAAARRASALTLHFYDGQVGVVVDRGRQGRLL